MSTRTGPLDPVKLFKIFRSLLEQKLTGHLVLTQGTIVKRLRVMQGHPVRVVSNARRESALAALQEQGLLSAADVENVNAARESQRATAEDALIKLGLVDRGRLQTLEKRLARRRLLELFTWREGEYTFTPASFRMEPEDETIDLVPVLVEAGAKVTPEETCASFCATFEGQLIRLTPWSEAYGAAFDAAFGTPNIRHILLRPSTVAELVGHLRDPERVRRQVFTLVIGGLGTFNRLEVGISATPAPTRSAEPAQPQGTASTPPPERRTGPNAVGAVDRTSTGPQTAGRTTTGPQTAGRTATGPQAAGRTATGPQAAGRTATGPQAAGRTTTGPQAARQAGSRPPVEPTPSPSSIPAATLPPSTTQPSRAPKPLDEKARAALAIIERTYEQMRKQTHYELLGVPKEAEIPTIRNQFRNLAREFHVDRFTRYGLPAEILLKIQEVFMAINRAHETLTEPDKRKEYDLQLEMATRGQRLGVGTAGPDVGAIFRSETLVRDGVMLLRNGSAAAAKGKFDEALHASAGDLVARAGLAFAEFLLAHAANKNGEAEKCRHTLEELVKDNETRDEPFLYLGRIYRTRGDAQRAMVMFKRALDVNPRCAEAASELRHLQRKVETSPDKGQGGLFGRKKA